jgi:hypothetical protein
MEKNAFYLLFFLLSIFEFLPTASMSSSLSQDSWELKALRVKICPLNPEDIRE